MNRVLIVDDSPLIRNSMNMQISQLTQQYLVAGHADNGMSALKWLEENYADICIADVRMPRMDGLELLAQIRQRYPHMTCIIVSAYNEFEYVKESIQLEAVDYILKPVDPDVLRHTLEKASQKLQQSRYSEAYRLALRQLPGHKDMLSQWIHVIRSGQVEKLPLLIVDTLDRLTVWAEDRFFLLNVLAMVWLNAVAEEMKLENIELTLNEGVDAGLGDPQLPLCKQRYYFRMCAVRRLEEGSHAFVDITTRSLSQPSRKIIEEIKRYVQQAYKEKLDYRELADTVLLSRNYMADLFKQETGMTIGYYIIQLRMEEAKRLLQDRSLKKYEIARQIGYEDYDHFVKNFKKHYGLSPMEYQKRLGI